MPAVLCSVLPVTGDAGPVLQALHVAAKGVDALLCCGRWSWQEEIASLDARSRLNEGNSADLVAPKGKGSVSR